MYRGSHVSPRPRGTIRPRRGTIAGKRVIVRFARRNCMAPETTDTALKPLTGCLNGRAPRSNSDLLCSKPQDASTNAGGVAAEESVSGIRALSVVSAALLDSMASQNPNLAWRRLAPPIDCYSVEISTYRHQVTHRESARART